MAYMKDASGRRLDAYTPASASAQAATIPAALGWDAAYPLNITLTDLPGTSRSYGAVDKTPEQLFDAASTARTAPGATFYVDVNSGLDTNDGLTVGTAFKSGWKAVVAANAAGVPSKIIAKPGSYTRARNFWNSGGAGTFPTVDIAFIADGGRVITGTYDDAGTPSLDATYTNCYSWAVANANRVVDMASLNRFGNYTELTNVPTATACNATPNSWNITAGTLYVNRRDRAAVTTANTRIYRPSAHAMSLRSPVNVYIGGTSGNDGWDFEGGSNIGVLDVTTTTPGTTKHVLSVKNSTFKYGGGVVDTTARSVSVESWQGLAFFQNCRADAAQTDGWNFHNLYAAASMNVVTLNCTADDNGRFPLTSCNSHTAHENVRVIDIAGYFRESHGGAVRNIQTSKALYVGTWVDGDHGDIPHGGVVPPTAFRADDSAQFWCDRTKVTMPGGSYGYMTGNGTAAIHKRNAWPTPAPDSGPGTYDTY